MERFVQYVLAGGLALVAGLWVVHLLEPWSLPWLGGGLLVGFGIAGLAAGIWREVDFEVTR